jgi:hypothetical protein
MNVKIASLVFLVATAFIGCGGGGSSSGGTPLLPTYPNGTACDDNNPSTTNDVYTNGICAGEVITCANTPTINGCACDDNNANTINDVYTNGVCVGVAQQPIIPAALKNIPQPPVL